MRRNLTSNDDNPNFVRRRLRFLTDRDGGCVFSSTDIDFKSNQTVEDVLRNKHHLMREVDADFLKEYNKLPQF